jgi:hypothetical protein
MARSAGLERCLHTVYVRVVALLNDALTEDRSMVSQSSWHLLKVTKKKSDRPLPRIHLTGRRNGIQV